MYWAPGAAHGPHQVFKEWADKYKGKFDDGWDAYRERVFERQKELGWIPADTKLTPRADTMASWDSIPESQRPFQTPADGGFRRLRRACRRAGRPARRRARANGVRDNTIIFYVFGDNGSSAEGQNGTHQRAARAEQDRRTRSSSRLAALDKIGGLEALGTPKTDNMYHAGWAWAGDTPFRYTKLVAVAFRRDAQSRWSSPGRRGSSLTRRRGRSFITSTTLRRRSTTSWASSAPMLSTDGQQLPIDGVSMAYAFGDPKAPGAKVDSIFREQWQPCASIMMAGSPPPSVR